MVAEILFCLSTEFRMLLIDSELVLLSDPSESVLLSAVVVISVLSVTEIAPVLVACVELVANEVMLIFNYFTVRTYSTLQTMHCTVEYCS